MYEPRKALRWTALVVWMVGMALAWPAEIAAQPRPAGERVSQDSPEGEESAGARGDGAPGGAARDELTLWRIDAQGLSTGQREALRSSLREALAGEHGRHLLSERALREHVAKNSASVPPCLRGVSPCDSPAAMAFDSLDLTLQIRLDVEVTSEALDASYRVVDARGQVTRRGTVSAQPNPRKLGYALVRAIYDATGYVSITSEPTGAAVVIDGESVGKTPLTRRLQIGRHTYRLTLPKREPVRGEFELRSARTTEIRRTLEMQPARLELVGEPKDAVVAANGREIGRVGETLELAPGHYTLEVRAEGYEPWRETAELTAGETVRREVTLERDSALIREVSPALVGLNHYVLRLSYEHTFHSTTFRGARDNDGGSVLEFRRFVDEEAPSDQSLDARRFVAPNGARLDAGFFGQNFGMIVLGLSYVSTSPDLAAEVQSLSSGEPREVTVESVRRLHLRPFQFVYRHFFDNFSPMVDAGIGINFQWVKVFSEDLGESRTLHQAEPFWTLGIGAQYFFIDKFYAQLRYGVQSYFNEGVGLEHQLAIGVGVALPNLFGLEPEPPETL